ncbi:cation:proton antiporter [Adhaeribacter aquaticus]|uniref:cation:proton antiporter n=1 Tax=Adhaeribacter aquaticus TaxID=299567 RepID=UPI000423B908|nr:cation:proton antiporter [Adhaeribacter aquaticus]
MTTFILVITVIGLAALAMAWLPSLLQNAPFSYAMIFLGLGYLLYKIPLNLPAPDPLKYNNLTTRLTELGVITTLMGTGLKINRDVSLKNWKIPLLLVSVTMLLCISFLGFMGWWVLGFTPAAAVLLGAVMAPTDPVLAADIQVGPPSEEQEDHVRFSLTSEAGLNDGVAFPFTWLAVTLALASQTGEAWFWPWFWDDLIYKIVCGVASGYFLGRALSYLLFVLPKQTNFPKSRDGFVAIAATLLVYGVTELVHGYGFIAVFIAGLTIRHLEKNHHYHLELHDFTEQIERLFLVILLLLFGGSLANGLLDNLTGRGIAVGLAFIFLARPLTTLATLYNQKITIREKLAISFFGIRGIGSFYYLAFALGKATFPEAKELWAIAGFIVLVSIIIHGVLAAPTMKYLDLRRTHSDLEIK